MHPNSSPVVSTYIHVPDNARIRQNIDSSSFGVFATIGVGDHGNNDATLSFRSPAQLERLAAEATRAAEAMRKAIELRAALMPEG